MYSRDILYEFLTTVVQGEDFQPVTAFYNTRTVENGYT